METDTNGRTVSWMETEAGKNIQKRLADEKTLTAIDHLLTRIDTLEQTVDKLASIWEQTPGMLAMAADTADEFYRQADNKGITVDERLRGALSLAEKLTAPETVVKLETVLNLADQLPGLVAMKVDWLDEQYRQLDTQGIRIEERLAVAMNLAEKLTAPAMVEKLEILVKLTEQLPGIVAMAVDTMDEKMKIAVDHGFDFRTLSDIAGSANTALTNAKTEPPEKVRGIFGLFRALRNPDRQKGLGFVLNFLKHFGKQL